MISSKLLLNTAIWFTTELFLNLVGLDTIADFSEFVFSHKQITLINQPSELTIVIPLSCPWIFGYLPSEFQFQAVSR